MILLDANLLVYAHVTGFAQHVAARAWLDRQFNETPRVGLPWPSVLAFVRLVTNPRIFERPESVTDAWRQAQAWLNTPNCWIPQPTENHAAVLGRMLLTPGLRANHVPDAHLAALAVEHGLTLCTTDSDFSRFQELRWQNPLA